MMKKKCAQPVLIFAVMFCLVGVLMWSNVHPVLLANDGDRMSSIGAGMILIPDENMPLTESPAQLEPESGEVAEGTDKEKIDMYEGLDETQIQYVDEVVKLVNEARAEAGVPALVLDVNLRKAAQVRAAECVGTFSHTRPDGTSYKTAIQQAGVESTYTGENVATGHTTPKMVVARLLKSEGHRANILNPNFTKIGIGLEKNAGNRYGGYSWTQLFVK